MHWILSIIILSFFDEARCWIFLKKIVFEQKITWIAHCVHGSFHKNIDHLKESRHEGECRQAPPTTPRTSPLDLDKSHRKKNDWMVMVSQLSDTNVAIVRMWHCLFRSMCWFCIGVCMSIVLYTYQIGIEEMWFLYYTPRKLVYKRCISTICTWFYSYAYSWLLLKTGNTIDRPTELIGVYVNICMYIILYHII